MKRSRVVAVQRAFEREREEVNEYSTINVAFELARSPGHSGSLRDERRERAKGVLHGTIARNHWLSETDRRRDCQPQKYCRK